MNARAHIFLCFWLCIGMSLVWGVTQIEDHGSETLTNNAWAAFNEGDFKSAVKIASQCVGLYAHEAKRQQKQLKNFASHDKAHEYWALNHVAACYYIMGESYLRLDKKRKALKCFDEIVTELEFAQCYDPRQNLFWKVAPAVKGKWHQLNEELKK